MKKSILPLSLVASFALLSFTTPKEDLNYSDDTVKVDDTSEYCVDEAALRYHDVIGNGASGQATNDVFLNIIGNVRRILKVAVVVLTQIQNDKI